jgi:hypothetical protein
MAIEAGLLTCEEVARSLDQMVANVRAAGAASIGLTLYPPYPEGFFKNPQMRSATRTAVTGAGLAVA